MQISIEELARSEFIADDFAAAGIESKKTSGRHSPTTFTLVATPTTERPYGPSIAEWAFACGRCSAPTSRTSISPDFREVIPAFEMVEKGFVTEQDCREFTFTNAAMLHTRNNPGFFKGTVVEQAVADELGLDAANA